MSSRKRNEQQAHAESKKPRHELGPKSDSFARIFNIPMSQMFRRPPEELKMSFLLEKSALSVGVARDDTATDWERILLAPEGFLDRFKCSACAGSPVRLVNLPHGMTGIRCATPRTSPTAKGCLGSMPITLLEEALLTLRNRHVSLGQAIVKAAAGDFEGCTDPSLVAWIPWTEIAQDIQAEVAKSQ